MPNAKQPSPARRLHEQMGRLLNGTKAHHDEVTEILIAFLAIQVSSYNPFERIDVWDAVIDTLDDMIEEISEMKDGEIAIQN